jgi:hypothetical protein
MFYRSVILFMALRESTGEPNRAIPAEPEKTPLTGERRRRIGEILSRHVNVLIAPQ